MPPVAVNPTNPVLSAVEEALPVASPPVSIVVQHQAAPPAPAALPVATPPVSIFVQHQATPPAVAAVVAPSVATNTLGSLNEFEEFLLDLDLESGP